MSEVLLYNGDCIQAMGGIADHSINLILTDPPYNLGNFMISRDIIGKRDGEAPALPVKTEQRVTIWDAIGDLAYLKSGEGQEEQQYADLPVSDYAKSLRGNMYVLHNHVATKHSKLALERLALIPPNCGKEVLPDEHLTKSIYSGTWSRMIKDDISVTITTRFDTPSSGRFTHPYPEITEAVLVVKWNDFKENAES